MERNQKTVMAKKQPVCKFYIIHEVDDDGHMTVMPASAACICGIGGPRLPESK